MAVNVVNRVNAIGGPAGEICMIIDPAPFEHPTFVSGSRLAIRPKTRWIATKVYFQPIRSGFSRPRSRPKFPARLCADSVSFPTLSKSKGLP
jgi:hypothetical protein